MGKVVKRSEIKKLAQKYKEKNKTIAFTNGCFDILHIGHVRYLKESKKTADILIVGLNSDASVKKIKGDSRPINNEIERAELLAELNSVDFVVVFDENSPSDLIDEIKPNVYTKGADYTLETLPEKDVVLKNNIKMEFIKFTEGKSTTNILKALNN